MRYTGLVVCACVSWLCAAEARANIGANLEPARGGAASVGGIPFEELARKLLAKYGLDKVAPAELKLDGVLKVHCVRADVGAFEVYFPRGGLEKDAELLKQSVNALVDAQETWLDTTSRAPADEKALRTELEVVQKWTRAWKPAGMKKLDLKEDGDLVRALGAPAAVPAASAIVRAALCAGVATDGGASPRPPTRVMLMPTRRDFVEVAAVLGWLSPENRGQFWSEGVGDWTQCFYFADQVIALQYAPPGRKTDDFETGIAMNERAPNVLEQQVVQLSLNSFFDQAFGANAPKAFIAGLGMNLVIDQFKEINTRVDGDLRSRVTEATEIFIAGGAAEGGFLPVNSAESRWRAGHGKDRFIGVLRQAQKDGDGLDKKAKVKGAAFAVRADDGGKTFAVRGPFWAASRIANIEVPKEFQGDCAEFLRVYKCGFVHWLRSKALPSEKAAREKFADLLQRLEKGDPAGGFEAAIAATYDGVPLSGEELDKSCLEGRFLAWLAKQP